MPRHRTRQHATHELTVDREDTIECSGDGDCPDDSTCDLDEGVCVDAYGTPKTTEREVLSGKIVEFDSGGTSFVRGSTGERVERTPTISGRGDLAELIEEGDRVTLNPLAESGGGPTITDLAVASIDVNYGRRARPAGTTIELESV